MRLKLDGIGKTMPEVNSRNEALPSTSPADLRGVPEREYGRTADGELMRDGAWRYERVSVAAYYLAQKRNFMPGNEFSDWTLAERQINATDEAGS